MKKTLLLAYLCIFVSNTILASEWVDKSEHTINFVKMDDNTKLEVLDWGGSGTPLILLTGLALNAHTFDNFAPLFTDSYRVLSISRVGHGNSDTREQDFSTSRLVKDIITVMKNMNIDSAIFAGHSFAGTELTYLGKHFPKKVKGLIYIDAVQALEYLPKVQESCPDVGQASIDIFKFQQNFYHTQRVLNTDGDYLPFADLSALGKLLTAAEERDYSEIMAPAISINHIPKETKDLLLGVGNPNQDCFEALNKMNYLGLAKFIKGKSNADVAAIQDSQHMIHMVTPEKLAIIMNNWLRRIYATNKSFSDDK